MLFSLGFLFWASFQGFKTRLLERGFYTLIRNALFPSPIDVRSHNLPTLWTKLLNGTPLGAGSDTICNSQNPPLADIVLFGLSLLGFPSRF